MSSGGSENRPNLQIMSQYIKDLSFENPSAPAALTGTPEMELGVDLKAAPVAADLYEVVLTLRVRASAEAKPLFLVELAYGGLARLVNVAEDTIQRTLLTQVPQLLFPFARRILADLVHDGGMPPLMIEPIDFALLYQTKMAQSAKPVETA